MQKFTIGVLGAADIATRRFLPALKQYPNATFAGVASRDPSKAEMICHEFGGKVYSDYNALLEDLSIDAVYIPLPPALHYSWAKQALECGKHVFLEKPATTNHQQTQALLKIAEKTKRVLLENYAFLYHRQMDEFLSRIASGSIGTVQTYEIRFGFPHRSKSDFRYRAALGGGALLDCGGYCIRLAAKLLGESCHLLGASLVVPNDEQVDLFGSALYKNKQQVFAHISFGMAHAYQCQVQAWGSKGLLTAPRIFTAPPEFAPVMMETIGTAQSVISLPADNQFLHMIQHFFDCFSDDSSRLNVYHEILRQSEMTDAFCTRSNAEKDIESGL